MRDANVEQHHRSVEKSLQVRSGPRRSVLSSGSLEMERHRGEHRPRKMGTLDVLVEPSDESAGAEEK